MATWRRLRATAGGHRRASPASSARTGPVGRVRQRRRRIRHYDGARKHTPGRLSPGLRAITFTTPPGVGTGGLYLDTEKTAGSPTPISGEDHGNHHDPMVESSLPGAMTGILLGPPVRITREDHDDVQIRLRIGVPTGPGPEEDQLVKLEASGDQSLEFPQNGLFDRRHGLASHYLVFRRTPPECTTGWPT